MKIHIGTSGWSYGHWIDKFYPKDLPKEKWLSFYSKHFNTVELNMSFYQFPKKEMLKNWQKKFPKNFLMTMKANRAITHIKKFTDFTLSRNFYSLADNLKQNLGCILFQTPPSWTFNKENFQTLKEFIKLLDKKKTNVLEFRHKSWWNTKVYDLLRKEKMTFCIVSGLDMPKDIVITSNTAYFRFHGQRYSTKYSEKELKDWAKKIKACKVKEAFVYFNNDQQAYAIENAKRLKDILKST